MSEVIILDSSDSDEEILKTTSKKKIEFLTVKVTVTQKAIIRNVSHCFKAPTKDQ